MKTEATPEVTPEAVEPVVPVSEVDSWLADQGLVPVSEDDLRGQEVPDEKEQEETPEAEAPVEPVEPAPVPPKTDDKPPKGFVPTQAVKEAREENRFLKEELKALKESIESLKKAPVVPEAPKDTFKELTKAEYLELAEEAPSEAMAYLLDLAEHKERVRDQKLQAEKQAETERYISQTLMEAQKAIETTVPGIYDEESTVQAELVEFAESLGFTEDLFYLTNPETLVILPGETKPVYLGKQAAKILSVIVNAKSKTSAAVPDETELRKKIEAEVLSKIKNLTPGKTFKSLADLPTSAPVKVKTATGVLTEAQLAKLSPEEQRAYLEGEDA